MTSVKNKSMIGMFVLGATALIVAAITLFGSGAFFAHKVPLVLYFEGSVGGLSIGAPVVFRGVQIGQVTDIKIQAEAKPLRFTIPVFIDLVRGEVEIKGEKLGTKNIAQALNISNAEFLGELIKEGFRAQLSQKSFVTGELQIMLDFYPGSPVAYRGDGSVLEIPTIPSPFEKLSKSIENLPLNELVSEILSVTKGLDAIVNSKHMQDAPANLDELLSEAKAMVADIQKEIAPLSNRLDGTLRSYNDLAEHVDAKVGPLADGYTQLASGLNAELKAAMATFNKAVNQATQTLTKIEKTAGSDSPTVVELRKALADVAAMARSIKSFADFLDRHPEALLQGKGPRR